MTISHISNLFLLFIVIFTTIFLRLSSSFEIPTNYKYTSILGPKLDKLPNQDDVIQLFEIWKKDHGRVYNDQEETTNKFDIFVSNLKYITETNAKRDSPHSALLGLTNFADMSSKEFEERYLRGVDMPAAADLNTVNVQDDDAQLSISCSAPSSLDWRTKDGGAVTYVQDQTDHCSSCWAFSALGAIEGITAIVTRNLVKLSVQELVDCNEGCDPGWVPKALDWVIKNKGIALDKNYPYAAKKGPVCKASKIPNSGISSINSYKQVEISENGLLCAVAKQPISVCLNAIPQDFQHYTNEIYEGGNCQDTTFSNHCMLIVGYDSLNGQDFWIVKNQWGTNWGIQGYMRIKRNTKKKYGVCGINAWAYNPVKYN